MFSAMEDRRNFFLLQIKDHVYLYVFFSQNAFLLFFSDLDIGKTSDRFWTSKGAQNA